MASYMKNWWDKHDMDRDGKGCFLILMAIVGGVFLAGAGTMALLVWAATR